MSTKYDIFSSMGPNGTMNYYSWRTDNHKHVSFRWPKPFKKGSNVNHDKIDILYLEHEREY